MDDYIKRQAVMDAYNEVQQRNGPWRFETLIESVPAADVRPVVRGRWENFRGKPRCSKCKAVWPEDYYDHNFCPRCGADMRGGSEQ